MGSDILEGIFNPVHIVAKVGYSASLIFYDSMLFGYHDTGADGPRVLRTVTHGDISAAVFRFVISLVFVLFCEQFSMTIMTAMIMAFVINAVVAGRTPCPLLKNYKQILC